MRLRYFRLARALARSTQPKKHSSKRVYHQPKQPPRVFTRPPQQPTYRAAQPPPPYGQQPYRPPSWGQQPSPYGQPPHYTHSQPHHYRGWVLAAFVLGYILSLGLVFIEIAITSGTSSSSTSSSSPGILSSTAAFLLIVVSISIVILDGRSFFTLFSKIQWRRLKGWQRIGLGFVYLCFWIMPAIYLVLAVQHFLRTRNQSLREALRSGWRGYRAKSRKTQVVVGLCCAFLVVSFFTFTSLAALADRASALALLTPTPAPQQTLSTSYATTPLSTTTVGAAATPTTQPTAKPTPTPTAKPVARAKPTPRPATPTACPGINCNPWGYNFTPGSLIYNPPSNFCAYFNCIASFWEPDDPGDGYVVQCADGRYSQSGGERGACSRHGGVSRPLYAP